MCVRACVGEREGERDVSHHVITLTTGGTIAAAVETGIEVLLIGSYQPGHPPQLLLLPLTSNKTLTLSTCT